MLESARVALYPFITCELATPPLPTSLTLPIRQCDIYLVSGDLPDVRVKLINYRVAGQWVHIEHLL